MKERTVERFMPSEWREPAASYCTFRTCNRALWWHPSAERVARMGRFTARRRTLLATAAAALTLAAPTAAHADLSWTQPQVLSPSGQTADLPRVAMNDSGFGV